MKVFENWVITRTLSSNREETKGGQEKLHCEGLHNFRENQIKGNEIGGAREMHIKFWLEKLKEGDYFGDLGVHGRTILPVILKKQSVRV